MKKIELIVLAGPSGVGKTALEVAMEKKFPNSFKRIISHTTRVPREKDGEVNGVNYHFVSMEEFNKLDLIESVKFADNSYGIDRKSLPKDHTALAVVEISGAEQIMKNIDREKILFIFLDLPEAVRKQRMLDRGDSIESVENRIKKDTIVKDFKNSNIVADVRITQEIPLSKLCDLIMARILIANEVRFENVKVKKFIDSQNEKFNGGK
jgi:guanylate kinase